MSDNPHVGKIADLLDPYITAATKNVGGKPYEGGAYQRWWLHKHPGRWALVGIDRTGLSRDWIERNGFKLGVRTTDEGLVFYAQLPHPEGEPLIAALKRTDRPKLCIPELTTSEFGWTAEELADACKVARENLFPVRASRR